MDIFLLDNKYQLAWAEYGAPDGEPVFYFHDILGPRLEVHTADGASRALSIRLIATDLPGHGYSSPHENFSLLDCPESSIKQNHSHKHYLKNLTLTINNGVNKIVKGLRCVTLSWQFNPNNIQRHIDIWHDRNNKNYGFAIAKYLVKTIKNTSIHFLKNKGHYFLLTQWQEALKHTKRQGYVNHEITI